MFALAQRQQQVELLREQRLVVVELLAEQRERLDEGAAAGHDLGAAARELVERGELLHHAYGIVGAEHGDGAGEADARGARGGGRQHDGRRRHGEVGAVVLADAEDVETDLVGQLDLLDQVAQALTRCLGHARHHAGLELAERVDADLHARSVVASTTVCFWRWFVWRALTLNS